jgi:aminoglycoside/choline kinase family phosphotransferase
MNQVDRQQHLNQWLQQVIPGQLIDIANLPGDASFRRYSRVITTTGSYMLMDAPPELENCKPFVAVAKSFAQLGLQVPKIFAADLINGFLLLSDFGDQLYLQQLNTDTADQLYTLALDQLIILQQCQTVADWKLPKFDASFMQQELDNFTHWYLQQHLGLQLNVRETALLQHTYSHLIDMAESQPQVCVHRDYHARNLMCLADNQVGILDFQDAVWGPITYDAVSLLRDCYITWPAAKVQQWLLYFYQQLHKYKRLANVSFEQFKQWFDWMGIQRHLKAIFIFARKYRRDYNDNYLEDIPRALQYIANISDLYPEFADWREWLFEKLDISGVRLAGESIEKELAA